MLSSRGLLGVCDACCTKLPLTKLHMFTVEQANGPRAGDRLGSLCLMNFLAGISCRLVMEVMQSDLCGDQQLSAAEAGLQAEHADEKAKQCSGFGILRQNQSSERKRTQDT